MLVVYAKTEPEAAAHGITAFIIEKDFAGFRCAQKLDKLGHRVKTGELVFEDCSVPAENILGLQWRGRRFNEWAGFRRCAGRLAFGYYAGLSGCCHTCISAHNLANRSARSS